MPDVQNLECTAIPSDDAIPIKTAMIDDAIITAIRRSYSFAGRKLRSRISVREAKFDSYLLRYHGGGGQ